MKLTYEGDRMSEEQETTIAPAPYVKPKKPEDYYGTFDTSIIYEYKDQPDIRAGRCDNCGSAHFQSTVGGGQYVRECRQCGMKKNI